ncbi:MAG TPA: hypothetical protein VG166_11570 [Caulobacteraceae bacterium]|nr:hypothetical protein [Caulobacteraceae bacterium]
MRLDPDCYEAQLYAGALGMQVSALAHLGEADRDRQGRITVTVHLTAPTAELR